MQRLAPWALFGDVSILHQVTNTNLTCSQGDMTPAAHYIVIQDMLVVIFKRSDILCLRTMVFLMKLISIHP